MIDNETLYKVAAANKANPYADIIPFVVQAGYPDVFYNGVVLQKEEVILYALPASTYADKEKVVGYTGKSAGVSVRVAKGVSVRTGSSKGKPIRENVREYSNGDLIITNKRLIFVAIQKGFEISIAKITAAKIIDKQSFMIQTSNTSKSIRVDGALTAYALALIEHVITSHANGKDLYKNYCLVQNSMTDEHKHMCMEVKQRTAQIKVKKKSGGCGMILGVAVAFIIFLLVVVVAVSQNGNQSQEDIDTANEENIVLLTDYTDEEIVLIENHPRIFDELVLSKEFVDAIGDERVNIVYTQGGKTQTLDEQEPYEGAVVTFHRHSTTYDYLGRFDIDIRDSEFATNMTLEQAVDICLSYLPDNFAELYKCDRAYIRETDNSTIYTYAMRLNQSGVDYHNNGNGQYSNYLSVYIVDYKEDNRWVIKSDCSAYGDKDVGWIDKYATPWDIQLVNE